MLGVLVLCPFMMPLPSGHPVATDIKAYHKRGGSILVATPGVTALVAGCARHICATSTGRLNQMIQTPGSPDRAIRLKDLELLVLDEADRCVSA